MKNWKYQVVVKGNVVALSTTKAEADAEAKRVKGVVLTHNPLLLKPGAEGWDRYGALVADAYTKAPDYDAAALPAWEALERWIPKMFKRIQGVVDVEFVGLRPVPRRRASPGRGGPYRSAQGLDRRHGPSGVEPREQPKVPRNTRLDGPHTAERKA